MEPSGSERALEASESDAFAGKTVGWRRADMNRTGSMRPSSLAIRRRLRVFELTRAAHRAVPVQVASLRRPQSGHTPELRSGSA